MAILKIRDENGNVVEVPALKGNKGDKGDKGDGYILTDADKSEIATRVNAVSYSDEQPLTDEQKQIARDNINAVSQAELDDAIANIGNAPNKEWKIIATGEVEEDGVTKITITKDNDGNPFEIYDALVVYIDAPIATETINIYLLVNNQYSNLAFQALRKDVPRFARITANWDGGNWAGISFTGSNSRSWADSVGGMTQYMAKKSPATSISLSTESTTPFPIGTKFELRGVVKV